MVALGTALATRVGRGREVVKRLAIGSITAFTLATTAFAQAPSPAETAQQPPPVFRSGAALVALNVTVTDGKHLVPGLTVGDFSVYEDGVLQPVQFFEAKNIPIDLIILLDTSASMSEKMPVVHEAAIGFLKTLRGDDRGAVVTFGDNVNIVQALTGDHGMLEQAIDQTQAHGSTALNNALYVAMKQFARAAQQSGQVRRQAIAVLSDGEDTSSVIGFDDVLGMARKSGINIYTICLQNKYSLSRVDTQRKYFSESDYAMKTLAQETGAQSFFPQTIQELKGIYAAIADELSNQYSIGYSPTNWHPDGRFRRIVVKVNDQPEFRPRARLGYTAESARNTSAVQAPQR
jgi:Ca-activated chloride channel family protein